MENKDLSKEPKAAPEVLDCGGTGLCFEAQADGIPCEELGHACETCDRAILPQPATPKA